MATITSGEEQEYIEKYVSNHAPSYVNLWIGLKGSNGHWNQWATNETLSSFNQWCEVYLNYSIGGNYGAFCNYPNNSYYVTVHNPSGEVITTVAVNEGEWIQLNDKDTTWLICEWDFA